MTAEREMLDRAAELRTEENVLARLRETPGTRVVVVRAGRLRIAGDEVVRVDVDSVGAADWALLGRDRDGSALLLASVPTETDSIDSAPEETWLGLRDVGGRLGEHESDLLVTAIALAGWLSDARHCTACGAALEIVQAGWARSCPSCGAEHFPRTDPAVIVAVESPDGARLLLGANANWRGSMYSCFAGFVEAGESLEDTVHRELGEEAGVRVRDLRYISSQAWPYPRSIMLGFRAVAVDEHVQADGEEILEVRWLSRDEIGSSLAGEGPVGLPGSASIARRLIEQWYEERA
ncbi:NAD(+) diphosphatase [Microbacterium suwonense]|uniref:NAD(+) diphosphatase n=1 Tax=Microbacterium suwonense TaxID=683047 RepID=UPI00361C60A9